MKYGLSDKQLQEIAGIISSYSQIEQALIFGSRAIDTYKEASDVDIAIKGSKADSKLAAALKDQLEEETYLPFFFDVIAYHSVQSEELKKHIRTKGKSIYRKSLEGWREVNLGDVAEIFGGFAFKSKDFSAIGKPVVKITEIQSPYVNLKNCEKINLLPYKSKNLDKYKVQKDDYLVAMTGATIGKVGKLIEENIAYINQRVAKIEAIEKHSHNKFIYYSIANNNFVGFVENTAIGAVQPNISTTEIGEFPILLPPLPEQKAIAEVLSSLDDKIELLHRQNKTLEDIGQTIFMEQFGKYQIGDRLPKDWRVGKIGDFVDILSGFAFKSKDFIEGGKFGLVTIKNVQNGVFVEKMKDKLNFVPEKMPDYCNLKTGDILLSLTGNVGRVCHVIGKNYLLNQRVAKLEAKNKTDFSFVYLFFRQKDILNLLEGIASGTAQQNLSPVKTKELKMIVPNGKILDYFAKITNPNIEKILKNKQQINTLENLRDTLLPKLMSGEARIKH